MIWLTKYEKETILRTSKGDNDFYFIIEEPSNGPMSRFSTS